MSTVTPPIPHTPSHVHSYHHRFHLSKDVNLEDLANNCPANLTGADLYALCSDAMLASMRKKICELEKQGTCVLPSWT